MGLLKELTSNRLIAGATATFIGVYTAISCNKAPEPDYCATLVSQFPLGKRAGIETLIGKNSLTSDGCRTILKECYQAKACKTPLYK